MTRININKDVLSDSEYFRCIQYDKIVKRNSNGDDDDKRQ